MARLTTSLTAKEIQSVKSRDKEYKLFDGGGLYLSITPKGGKCWRLKYRFNNKEYEFKLSLHNYNGSWNGTYRYTKKWFRNNKANIYKYYCNLVKMKNAIIPIPKR